MAQIAAPKMREHLGLAVTDVTRDGYIDDCIVDAEDTIKKYLRRDLDAEFPGGWEPNQLRALRILTAHYFMNREAIVIGSSIENVPMSVKDILSLERDLS